MEDGSLSEDVKQCRGVKQGGSSSPTLFVWVLAGALHNLIESWKLRGFGFVLDGLIINILCFADDILLLAKTQFEAQRMLVELETTLGQIGLELSPSKSQFCKNIHVDEMELFLDGKPIMETKTNEGLLFLGCQITWDGEDVVEVLARIRKSWGSFFALKSWLLNRSIGRNKRLELWSLAMSSTLLWGAGTWTLTERTRGLISAMENAMYRSICLHPRRPEELGWQHRSRCTKILREWHTSTGRKSFVSMALVKKWTFAGHIARMNDDRLAKQITTCRGATWRHAAGPRGQQHARGHGFRRWENILDRFGIEKLGETWFLLGSDWENWHWNGKAKEFSQFRGGSC
jgi:hypothetical protein